MHAKRRRTRCLAGSVSLSSCSFCRINTKVLQCVLYRTAHMLDARCTKQNPSVLAKSSLPSTWGKLDRQADCHATDSWATPPRSINAILSLINACTSGHLICPLICVGVCLFLKPFASGRKSLTLYNLLVAHAMMRMRSSVRTKHGHAPYVGRSGTALPQRKSATGCGSNMRRRWYAWNIIALDRVHS